MMLTLQQTSAWMSAMTALFMITGTGPHLVCAAFAPITSSVSFLKNHQGRAKVPQAAALVNPLSSATTTTTTRKRWRQHQQSGGLRASPLDEPTDNKEDIAAPSLSLLDQALEKGDLRGAVEALQSTLGEDRGSAVNGNSDDSNNNKNNQSALKLSRSQWNQIFDAIEERTTNAEENDSENLRRLMSEEQLAEFPSTSAARSEMTDMYQTLRRSGQLRLFGAVDASRPETSLLASGSKTVPPPLLEAILNLPMKALTPQPTNSLLLAGAAVAILEGLVSLSLNISLNTLVLATLLIVTCDRLFLNGAAFESLLKVFSPGVQDKILRHEAGHFLIAYLLGCPVEGIVLSAWAALQDKRFGGRTTASGDTMSAGTSFFDPELSRQINARLPVTRASIDRYSIIVMAGIAAEADFYGRADGGAGDELALVAFLSQLNPNFNNNNANGGGGGAVVWNSESIRNQARWGALQAVLLLREYQPAYAALVDALERGGTLGDCIFAIEQAARQHNLQPVQRPLGYLVQEQQEGTVVWKKIVQKQQEEEEEESINGGGQTKKKKNDTNGGGVVNMNGSDPSLTTYRREEEPEEESQVVQVAREEDDDDPDTMSQTLQQYRAQVQARLQEVDQKLQELQQQEK